MLFELVPKKNKSLLLRLQFHLGAQHIDSGHDPGILLIHRALIQRLGGVDLSLRRRDLRLAGNRLQIQAGDAEHDHIASVLSREPGGAQVLRASMHVAHCGEIQQRLTGIDAGIKYIERADNIRDPRNSAGKTERLKIDLLARVGGPGGYIGQQAAPCKPPRGLGRARALFGEEEPEVLFEAAVYCIG